MTADSDGLTPAGCAVGDGPAVGDASAVDVCVFEDVDVDDPHPASTSAPATSRPATTTMLLLGLRTTPSQRTGRSPGDGRAP